MDKIKIEEINIEIVTSEGTTSLKVSKDFEKFINNNPDIKDLVETIGEY